MAESEKGCTDHYLAGSSKQANLHLVFTIDKLKLTGRNLGQVFNSGLGCTCIGNAIAHITKHPNLKLKTQPKLLLGSLPLAFMLCIFTQAFL